MRSLLEIIHRVNNGMTKEEANDYLKLHVEECVALGDDKEEATKIFLQNLGYIAGYYDRETADRVYDLFDTQHPVFGRTWPSPEEAFRMGIQYADRSKEHKGGR